MVQIPDSAKPYVDGFLKYHFWIFGAVVPLILLPSVFSANGDLQQKIQSQRSTIDSHMSALQSIQSEANHANHSWVDDVDVRTKKLRQEILGQWQLFWNSQQSIRVWSQELGGDFLDSIRAVEAGQQDRLPSNLLQRYQNSITEIVRTLPGRMGCKDLMQDDADKVAGATAGATTSDDTESPEASASYDPLVWSGEDQKRLLATFAWHREPSTVQVRLAQEELWVYGLFCDAIRKINEGATGAFNSTITTVDSLLVGYPAAEEAPGGQGGSRIMWKSSPKASAEGEAAAAMPLPMDGPKGRPVNQRFDASSGDAAAVAMPAMPGIDPALAGGEGGVPVVASPDDTFYEWIYVDFQDKPLTTQALKSSPDATMVHLVPFRLRVVIDQRKIDRLIKELAVNPIPIDVREVRINPGAAGTSMANPLSAPTIGSGLNDGPTEAGGRRRRPYDVTLEIRGTVGLATPPDEKPLGGGEAAVPGQPGDAS